MCNRQFAAPDLGQISNPMEFFRGTGPHLYISDGKELVVENSTITFGVLCDEAYRQRVKSIIESSKKIYTNSANNPLYLVYAPRDWRVVYTHGFETIVYTFQRRKGRFSVTHAEYPNSQGPLPVSEAGHRFDRKQVNLLVTQMNLLVKKYKAELISLGLDL